MVAKHHLEVLKIIHDRLADSSVTWVVTGSLGMALQGMRIEVHDIDLQTDEVGAYEIEKRFSEYVLQPVRFVASERIQSHLGTLAIKGVKIEIMGALQKWIEDQGWEEPVDVAKYRRFVEVNGMRIPVLSLAYEQEAYLKLGRVEKAAAIERWLRKRVAIASFQSENKKAVRE
jgi:hypothetical protein